MRYHFVLNGYLQNCQKVLQEMEAFKHTYLSEIEEGVTYLYCREEKQASAVKRMPYKRCLHTYGRGICSGNHF